MLFEIRTAGGGSGSGGGIQKVANAAARTALTPANGDFVVQLDTDDVWYWDGSAWQTSFNAITNASSLATVISGLSTHIANATGAHAASAISFTPADTITSINVQNAIVEALTDARAYSDVHKNNATGAHAASAISFTPGGTVAATDAQAAIAEVASEANTRLVALEATTHSAVTLAAFGSTPNANGLTLSTQALNMQPADNTNPGGVSTVAQNMAGEKRFSTGVQVGTTTALASNVVMGVVSTTKGSIPMPLMTTAQRTAIATPTQGMMVYDTDLKGPMYHNGTNWTFLDNRANVIANSSITTATSITPGQYRDQVIQVSGNGGDVDVTDVLATNTQEGDRVLFIGTSDTNTVSFITTSNLILNGSCTLGADDCLCIMRINSKWREAFRNV